MNVSLNVFHEKEKEMVISDFFDCSDYEEALKSQESDITGMTAYDKFKIGLDTADGADSDMDGLTDKEEIEKYHTDPTKASTSGDMYPDGYKVAHDMDLTKCYKYNKNDLGFPDNTCDAVSLEATEAGDFNACVSDFTCSNMYNLTDKDVLKVYSVFCYSGYVTIDLSLINKSLSSDDVNVYVQDYYSTKAHVVKFTSDQKKKKITLSEAYDYKNPYIIYLVKEKGTLAKVFTSYAMPVNVTFGSYLNRDGTPESSYGTVYGWFSDLKIKYVKTKDEAGEEVKEKLVETANKMLSKHHMTISEDNIIATTKEDVDKTISFSKKLQEIITSVPLICGNDGAVSNSCSSLYTYYVYDDSKNTDFTVPISDSRIEAGRFDCNKDILPFRNFGTEKNPNGVCAGIAHLTSVVHNTGTVPDPVKEYKIGEVVYSYDLTNDEENKTLLDKGLHNYKSKDFIKEHKDESGCVTKNLTDGEQSFINLINYFLAKEGNAFSTNEYVKGVCGKDTGKEPQTMYFYDGTVVRNTVMELDNGNIVDACFLLNDGSRHAVNLVGYERADSKYLGENIEGYVFYVYDSNHPDVLGTLTCEIHKHAKGEENLIYSMNIPGAGYSANSGGTSETSDKVSLFVALDSNFNVLNK